MFSRIRFRLALLFAMVIMFTHLTFTQTVVQFNGREYIERDGKWYELYLGEEWEVADVISVRFEEGAAVHQRIANLSGKDWDNQVEAYRVDLGIEGTEGVMLFAPRRGSRYGYHNFRTPERADPLQMARDFFKSDQVEKAYTTIYFNKKIYVRREGKWYVIEL